MNAFQKQPPSLFHRHILVVEDDYFIAEEMVRDFEAGGAIVIGPAPTVAAAMAVIEASEQIDGAILDINLNGEMAFPVADVLCRRQIPMVFATGYERESVPPIYERILICKKPVEPASLAQALFG